MPAPPPDHRGAHGREDDDIGVVVGDDDVINVLVAAQHEKEGCSMQQVAISGDRRLPPARRGRRA